MDHDPVDANLGISRRTLLRRGAIVGGTLVWAAPAVQTIARPAFGQATGSPVCTITLRIEVRNNGTVIFCATTTFAVAGECCDCIDASTGPDPLGECLPTSACAPISVVGSSPC